jgi:hypothetical protein
VIFWCFCMYQQDIIMFIWLILMALCICREYRSHFEGLYLPYLHCKVIIQWAKRRCETSEIKPSAALSHYPRSAFTSPLICHDIVKSITIFSSISKKYNHWYNSRRESARWFSDTWRYEPLSTDSEEKTKETGE